MKVTYQTCCGVDVHKSFLVATIVKTTGNVEPSYQKKRFSTFNHSILEFKQWLLDNNCRDVCMESTGKYWIPVFNFLEDEIDAVIESIEGYQMTDAPKYRMRLVRAHMDYITSSINDADSIIKKMISSEPDYENAIQLLTTIPGVKRDSAITIIPEIGTDMTQFSSSKRLCCWAGLTPGSNESASKKKSVRITRAGVYLKPALVQCAHAAVKSSKSPYYKKKYESLVKRRGKKRAIIAVARMILTAIFQMLSTGEQWNPSDLYKIDMPQALVEKQKAKAIKQAKKLLLREGIISESQLVS